MALPESIEVWDGERAEQLVDPHLDFDYIDTVAADVAAYLVTRDPVEANYQPGDGTRYKLVFTPLKGIGAASGRTVDGRQWGRRAIDGMSDPEHPDYYDPSGCLLSFVEGGCYPIRLGERRNCLSSEYVAEHWKQTSVSAVSIAILLRAISYHLDRFKLKAVV